MTSTAHAQFTVDTAEPSPVDWDGGSMSHTRFAKTYTGDVVGTSVVEATMLVVPDGPAVYVGVERLDVRVEGTAGTFLLLHQATTTGTASWTVVEGSGTGDLAGITGTAELTDGHGFELTHQLP